MASEEDDGRLIFCQRTSILTVEQKKLQDWHLENNCTRNGKGGYASVYINRGPLSTVKHVCRKINLYFEAIIHFGHFKHSIIHSKEFTEGCVKNNINPPRGQWYVLPSIGEKKRGVSCLTR